MPNASNRANRIALIDKIIEAFWQQRRLIAIGLPSIKRFIDPLPNICGNHIKFALSHMA